jgi:hypothetical protein
MYTVVQRVEYNAVNSTLLSQCMCPCAVTIFRWAFSPFMPWSENYECQNKKEERMKKTRKRMKRRRMKWTEKKSRKKMWKYTKVKKGFRWWRRMKEVEEYEGSNKAEQLFLWCRLCMWWLVFECLNVENKLQTKRFTKTILTRVPQHMTRNPPPPQVTGYALPLTLPIAAQ